MKIAENITDLIGKTPLVKLTRVVGGVQSNLFAAKLEQNNPGGSVKDRAALNMINQAERDGLLKNGSTIIEATSGNTGIALALIGAARGYSTLIVMPESMSLERQRLLKGLGARVELTAAHLGMRGSIERAISLHKAIPDSFLVSQFENKANPSIHEQTTAEEIIADTDGKVTIFVAGVGTGGTITGVGRRLKQFNSSIKVIGVEPSGSSVLNNGRCGPHAIQGIGPGFIPSIYDPSVVDTVVTVTDQESYEWTRRLMSKEGILGGISSGAAICGAVKYVSKNDLQNQIVVVLFPDSSERYLSIPMLLPS